MGAHIEPGSLPHGRQGDDDAREQEQKRGPPGRPRLSGEPGQKRSTARGERERGNPRARVRRGGRKDERTRRAEKRSNRREEAALPRAAARLLELAGRFEPSRAQDHAAAHGEEEEAGEEGEE